MKSTLNDYDFVNQWPESRKGQFSREGLFALYDFLTEWEGSIGEDIEYDPIAFCCEYTEYENMEELKENYPVKNMKELKEKTEVIEIPDTDRFIIRDY